MVILEVTIIPTIVHFGGDGIFNYIYPLFMTYNIVDNFPFWKDDNFGLFWMTILNGMNKCILYLLTILYAIS